MPTAPRYQRDFEVAIICALPLEAENVRSMFDICWEEDEGKQYDKSEGDQNTYTTGAIGRHNVVLVHMPSMGSTIAALSAAGLRTSFPGIRLALVVGICGVVPTHVTTKEKIFLGDVIISTAVIQYDFGRQYPSGFLGKKGSEDSLGRASPEIRSFIQKLQMRQVRQRWSQTLTTLVHSKEFQDKVPAAKYPGQTRDQLFEPTYTHQHRSSVKCDKCHNNPTSCPKTCDELQCEEEKLIRRGGRNSLHGMEQTGFMPHHSLSVHLGRFGSANTVMKSGLHRDRIATADEVIAFEMEGAGVWEQYPTLVIKAACDYADSHKNKDWQDYAAAMAAACVKVFLNEWIIPKTLEAHLQSPEPVWYVCFDQVPGFVGRADELGRLEQKLFDAKSHRIVSVLGLGGVGKSRLALELVYQIKSKHPDYAIFWIQAAGQLTFEKDMLEVGRKLGVAGIDEEKADVKNLVKQRLSFTKDKWFLILDNADDESLWTKRSNVNQQTPSLVNYIPRTTNGSILVTTRSRHVASFLAAKEVIELRALSSEEATDMFTNGLDDSNSVVDQATLSVLLDKLAHLPLAIVQATAFINMTQRSVQTYLQLLDQREEEVIKLLSEDFGDQSRYPNAINPIATTWLISFTNVQNHHPLAAKFLSFMACLHEKGIPLSILPAVESEIDIIKAIAVLTGYSFVTRQIVRSDFADEEELYDIHRLVQLAARNWLKLEDTLSEYTKACTQRLAQVFPPRDNKHKSIWTRYLPHAQHLCENTVMRDLPEQCNLLEKMGSCFIIDGKYDDAVKARTTIVNWRENKFGVSDRKTLQAYNNLGDALIQNGKWSVAEKYIQQALKYQKELLDMKHPDTLNSMASLAVIFQNQGRYTQAEELQVQVMETRRRVLGTEHPDTLTSMNNLALTYRGQGRYTQAEELQVQEMETSKRVQGTEHPDTLTSMNNLALTYRGQGRYTQAEELQVQEMETSKRVQGTEHPDTLSSMNNLALTYRGQGRYTQAEELEVQVMETRRRVLGTEHPDTLTSMNNLASTYGSQGRYTQAEELQVQVMETRRRVLGTEHPDTLTSMNNLASTYGSQGRYTQAEELQVQEMETSKRVLGTEHPDTLTSMNNLASTYSGQGRYTQAEELQVQVMETSKRVLGTEHPNTLSSMNNLALTYRGQGRYTQAEDLQVQVMETRRRLLGTEHPDTLTSMANLAFARMRRGLRKEALTLLEDCVQRQNRTLGPNHPSTAYCLAKLESWKSEE